MTTAVVTGAMSLPSSDSTSAPNIDGTMLHAQLDLATEWRFWCLLQHRDGRVFAGRAGDLRIFGTTMVRIDVAAGARTTIYGLHPEMISHWTICSEEHARTAAAIIGIPEQSIGGGHGWPETGALQEVDDGAPY